MSNNKEGSQAGRRAPLKAITRFAGCLLAAALTLPATAQGAEIALFFDSGYVDTQTGGSGEAVNLRETLEQQGHTVNTFTGTTGTAWSNALSGVDALAIPEQESAALAPDLEATAVTAIDDFVTGGGSMVVMGTFNGRAASLMNTVFGWGLSDTSTSAPSASLTAADTIFSGAAASLTYRNAVTPISAASLPGVATPAYVDDDNSDAVWVFEATPGAGLVSFLGWDWFEAAPEGSTNDPDWFEVLNLAVTNEAGPATSGAVDLDDGTGVDTYAREIIVPAVLSTGSDGHLALQVELGFSVTSGESVFLRYDLDNAVFETELAAGDFLAGTGGNLAIAQGGMTGDDFVIVELTATEGATIPNDATVTVTVPDVSVDDRQAADARYRLYDTSTDAVNATNNTLKDVSSEYFNFGKGFSVACTSADPPQIDVTDPTRFEDESANRKDVALVEIGANEVLNQSGELVVLDQDYFSPGSTVTIAGSTAAFGNADGFTLNGGNPDTAPASGAATWTTPTNGPVSLPLGGGDAFAVDPDGTNDMAPSAYELTIADDGDATFDVGAITTACGQLRFSGSSDRVDFALTPGSEGGFFDQFFRITNPSRTTGDVTVTVTNDVGVAVTFPLGAIPGVSSDEIVAGGSTKLISVQDIFDAAKAADATFDLASGSRNKLRVEVRGEFGDDVETPGGNTVASDRATDGIYIQALTVSNDNTSFFQTR